MTDRIKPDYRVIAIDETRNWSEAVTAITGRIAGVYVVNFAEVTHLCSLEGSHWGEFLCNITEHYVREPDGYHNGGIPIYDEEWAADNPEAFRRSLALVEAWKEPFYGLKHENAGESGSYFSERALDPEKGSKIDMEGAGWADDPAAMSAEDAEEYRKQRDQAAYEAAREYECNGEEWEDLAPWK